jgi:uncharacterized protein (TIGR02147 family)
VPDAVRVHAFSYLDFRAFLRDLYAAKKVASPAFSHRAFSRRAGLRSTNYLHLVVGGKRNLTQTAARSFAKGFGLAKEESDYFCALVRYNQAKVADERAEAFAALGRFRKFREVHELASAQSAYHSTWYLPAIRELAARADFRDDPKWIANQLVPRISTAEARRAVALLVELGLLIRRGKRLERAAALVSTGEAPLGHHLVAYHRAMLTRASESMDFIARDEREISSVTLCVSRDMLARLKQRIVEFRHELLQMAELEGPAERVVQINFQLFPMSKEEE